MDEGTSGAAPKAKRSRKKAATKQAVAAPSGETRSFRWELAELPSSQHRAGLAGLALCVQFLGRKSGRKGVCVIEALDARGLTLKADAAGMQELFDDVYAATLEEQQREKKFQKKDTKEEIPPKRELTVEVTDKKGNAKTKTVYVYDQVVPRGQLVGEWDAEADRGERLWLKLWRDLVWTTLRGNPAAREPFDARAEGRPSSDGIDAWVELADTPKEGKELPSTYYLGAQAKSAECVPFRDLVRTRFLLHFWPFAVSIYVPAALDREGDRTFQGYALAVPDVSDLHGFVEDWPAVMRERGSEKAAYLPRDAIVDVAAESGLDTVRRMLGVIARRQGAGATRSWLSAVDVFHVEKDGNNVRMRGVARVDPERSRSDAYARVRAAYWSPVFRRQRILNVLDGQPWWRGFGRVCATAPEGLTLGNEYFRHDSRIAFTEVEMKVKDDVPEGEKTLEQVVFQAVRAYVFGRLASKHQLEWSTEKAANPAWKKDYEDKKEKLAREAFLAVRSRTGSDFVTYFTGTLCSVPQRLGERGYLALARALHDEQQVERVRSLTLLALSASA